MLNSQAKNWRDELYNIYRTKSMDKLINPNKIMQFGFDFATANIISQQINLIIKNNSPPNAWQEFSKNILSSEINFDFHLFLFLLCYPERATSPETAVAWQATQKYVTTSHLSQFMLETNCKTVKQFHAWSTANRELFWNKLIKKLNIKFITDAKFINNLNNPEKPLWLINEKFNIVDSCFTADPNHIAIIYQDKKISYRELENTVQQIAGSLIQLKFLPGDAIAIILPMHPLAVAIYLAIIKIGCVVVSIADSFSAEEINTRLKIANTKAIFTQGYILRDKKILPLYEKIIINNAPKIILLDIKNTEQLTNKIVFRKNDLTWEEFFQPKSTATSYPATANTNCNILFSSGTTGTPKAIPWTHTTPLKAAGDAFLYQNITKNDVIAWPTNLGWMMGPWLVFAGLINQATIALYEDTPKDAAFGKFIQDAKVTILGVVPTLVAHWRQTNCLQNCNWQNIRIFSSTGECSNPDDMLFLMSRTNYQAPVIEYCGGTEIGGAYLTSTLLENNCPSVFTTPTMGLDFILLDEKNSPANNGEVALMPPSIGLSTELINADHHAVYFAGMPKYQENILRRHGDQLQRLTNGSYQILGRIDDTMNLGGIKISSAEIERIIATNPNISESAAIAIKNNSGLSQLIIFCVIKNSITNNELKKILQQQINHHLNPLFKIHDVIIIDQLPRTTSGKIIRRVLRDNYYRMIQNDK